MEKLSNQQIVAAGVTDWRKLSQPLQARFLSAGLSEAAAFVGAVAEVVGVDSPHLEMRLASGVIDLSLCTHEEGRWVTAKDIELARRISEVAEARGLEADPTAVTQLEMALDTSHEEELSPFWSVLLTGSIDNKVYDSIFDPTGRIPAMWFQGTDDHTTPRQRWHFDVWLAPEVAGERIVAAVAAGGSIVDESGAPAYTVLADPDGNRVCVCTAQGR